MISWSWEEVLLSTCQIFEKYYFDRLREAHLRLKPKKCHFAKREVLYLGYVVSNLGISANRSIVEAVEKFPIPTSTKQV